jgi:hypothetical protein
VIIMEYCNLGPLHHYMAERRFVRQLQIDPSQPSGSSVGGAGPPVQVGVKVERKCYRGMTVQLGAQVGAEG